MLAAPQVWIIGGANTVIRSALASEPVLLSLAQGAPAVHVRSVHFLGHLRVDGGELFLTDCRIEDAAVAMRRRLNLPEGGRAVTVVGGSASLTRTVLRGHPNGAVLVRAAILVLDQCSIQDSQALTGGAILMDGDAKLMAAHSKLTNNSATLSGGALQVGPCRWWALMSSCTVSSHRHTLCSQVNSGHVQLSNQTLLKGNSAPHGQGSSIYLSATGTRLQYTLPAPAGYWLNLHQGLTFVLEAGAEDSESFPYPCPAGRVGGTSANEQSTQQCARAW